MKDLSQLHRPVSNWFKQPAHKDDWDQYRLSTEQIEFFQENGYLSNIKLLDSWQVDLLNQELNEITDATHPGNSLFYEFHSNESSDKNNVLFHALGAWRIVPGFHDVIWNPAFVMAASQLLGDKNVRFWHDQLFCKPALHGGVVAWHQDYAYWTRTVPMQHLTCWVGLDDATRENGCLHYIPGSHTWGLLKKPELAGKMESIMDYLTTEQKSAFKPVPIEMKKGYGSFHHPLLLHGSYDNKSAYPRRAFVLNVFADGTTSDTHEEVLKGVPAIPAGKEMTGQFFPLIFDGSVSENKEA